jgi:DNA-binding GntR family transcriptional regulator
MKDVPCKQSLKLRAYQYVKQNILDCRYAPGEFLNEQKLCEEMGNISRTPVRDALGRLEQEGLITILPKRGTMVTGVSVSDIRHIFEVRLLLEPYALKNYGAGIPQEKWLAFRLTLADIDRCRRDPHFYYVSDDDFHAVIIEAMPNRYLRGAYASIRDANMRLRVICGKYGLDDRVEDTFAEHRAILTACISADWDAATRALTYHLEQSRDKTFERLIHLAGTGLDFL